MTTNKADTYFSLIQSLLPAYTSNVLISGGDSERLENLLAEKEIKIQDIISEGQVYKHSKNKIQFDAVIIIFPPERKGLDCIQTFSVASLSQYGALLICSSLNDEITEQDINQCLISNDLLPYKKIIQDEYIVLMAVQNNYDPVKHSHELFSQGHPQWASEVLLSAPLAFYPEPEDQIGLILERQHCLLAWDKLAGEEGRLGRFWNAKKEFSHAVYVYPRVPEVYLCQAEFWRRIGDEEMALRLLQSFQTVMPSDQIEKQISECKTEKCSTLTENTLSIWQDSSWPRRILVLTHQSSDFGMDPLYDSLCSMLGSDNVVEFPWKPTLHGVSPELTDGYPCFFNHPGEPMSVEEIVRELDDGKFDLIIFADMVQRNNQTAIRAIMKAAKEVPVVIVDTWDDCANQRNAVLEYIGRPSVDAYFKREMLTCGDYGENAFPLPFGYPDELVPENVNTDRPQGVFWAGNNNWWARRLYLEHIESALQLDLSKKYSQAEYAEALRHSRIGLSIFGLGFDTARYWEVPANGCMLLAERPPIRIPHNFEDDKTAVFYDDLKELEEKLRYYVANPEKAQRIAIAGHDHLKRYHTSSVRARQLLATIKKVMEVKSV